MQQRRLLVVTAHPDDEVLGFGGLIHRCARAGVPVTLVCATRGEVGEIANPALATPETLGAVREAELRAACAILGVADVRFLGFRDSGVAGAPTNAHSEAFCAAPADLVVPRLVAILTEIRPSLVLTWDPAEGHPDHQAAGRHTTAACDAVAATQPAQAPAALYYAVRPPHVGAALRAALRGAEASPPPDPPTPLDPAVVAVDVMAELPVKKAARAAHRTQLTPTSWVHLQAPDLERPFSGTEYFRRARPPLRPGAPDTLLYSLLGWTEGGTSFA